jgi:hypothetical protein
MDVKLSKDRRREKLRANSPKRQRRPTATRPPSNEKPLAPQAVVEALEYRRLFTAGGLGAPPTHDALEVQHSQTPAIIVQANRRPGPSA